MKKYFKHLQENTAPHERRQFAMRAAGALTTVLFVTWAASLGVRLANPGTGNPSAIGGADSTQTAAVVNYQTQTNGLEVATTSVFNN
ncbi:hypothetical protein HYS79_03090 [Patescibacteria group bacterium]|nr:hypothetical protein [Patescibacteria group bacterium]